MWALTRELGEAEGALVLSLFGKESTGCLMRSLAKRRQVINICHLRKMTKECGGNAADKGCRQTCIIQVQVAERRRGQGMVSEPERECR